MWRSGRREREEDVRKRRIWAGRTRGLCGEIELTVFETYENGAFGLDRSIFVHSSLMRFE